LKNVLGMQIKGIEYTYNLELQIKNAHCVNQMQLTKTDTNY